MARGLVVVTAPPGAGKSQLLRAWAGAYERPVAWATLGPDDRDPMHLWAHLLGSLQGQAGRDGDSVLARLRPTPVLDERFVTRLLDAWEALDVPVVLVVDDLHEVDGSGAAESLADAVLRGPERLPLVVASRTEPALPLHRLRLLDALTEIDARDLTFTLSEARELFELYDVPVTHHQLLQVLDRTEGWAAGLRLAVLALRGRADLDAAVAQIAGDQRPIADYFAREVLDRLAPDLVDFMLRTSVVPKVSASLADALTGGPDSQRVLEHLERENLFVVGLDEHREWYRYHHLFADVLRQRLSSAPPDVTHDLHRRAAGWFAEQGEVLEACRQLRAAGDWHELAELTCTTAGAMAFDLTRTALADVLGGFPSELLAKDAWVATAAAMGRFAAYDAAGVRDHVREARLALSTSPVADQPVVAAVLQVLETQIAWLEDDLDGQVSAAPTALKTLAVLGSATVPALPTYRTSVRSVLGMGQLWSGRLVEAETTLKVVASVLAATRSPNALLAVHVHGALGVIASLQGRLRVADDEATTALRVAEESGWLHLPQAARGHLALAVVHLLRDEQPACRLTIERARTCLRSLPNRFVETALDLVDVRLRVSAGDVAGAATRVARLREVLDTWQPSAYLLRWCDVVEAEVAIARGEAAAVVSRLADAATSAPGALPAHWRAVAARAHLACTDPVRALEVLAPLHADPPAELAAAVDLWLLTAVARDLAGDETDAVTALSQAVELAAAEGIVRPFLLVADAVGPMLRRHRSHAAHQAEFVSRVLEHLAVAAATVVNPRPEHPLPTLTERELSTLRLLPTMMTNVEIADELYVSVNTVKTHLKSLYRKLGVSGRREAVVIAREHGLIRE